MLKKLAFLLVILVGTWLLLEFGLILAGISFPLLYQPDAQVATLLKPNLNVRYTEEGNAIVQTNSRGFRDLERNRRAKEGNFRIAIIGDSFCEAIQVERKESFGYLLEQGLNRNGIPAEVLNFGISGFGTAQEFELLRHRVLDYGPDLVILGMFLGNDIGDNSREINPGQLKPYYDLVDGQLVLDNRFRQAAEFIEAQSWATRTKAACINSSRVLQLLNRFYSRFKNRHRPRANVGIGLDPDLYAPPQTTSWTDAWQVTEALLLACRDQSEKNGASFLVVTFSNPIQVHPDPEVRRAFQNKHDLESLFYPDDRIAGYCKQKGIEHLQLAPRFLEDVETSKQPIYYHGFPNTLLGAGHWNSRGHQRAGELLVPICQEIASRKQNTPKAGRQE